VYIFAFGQFRENSVGRQTTNQPGHANSKSQEIQTQNKE